MSGVDNRIVTMQFNNSEFERNAKTSLTTLQKIKESMNFGTIANASMKSIGALGGFLQKVGSKTPFAPMIKATTAGLSGVGTVMSRIGLRNPFANATTGVVDLTKTAQQAAGPAGIGMLEGGVTSISKKFVLLSSIAVTAISNITNRMVNAGLAWAKSFTVAPILDGLHEYELNLKSIQTVQANTDRPLKDIEASLDQLNRYSDQTIYNFSEMARNVGTFTAAGVDLETSVSSIKGIANLAALSGSSSEQAATAMYQLSQAIAAGRVGLMDWNSVVNAGMGGKKLQNALAQTAIAMGQIKAESVKMVGPMKKLEINGSSFRESIMAKPGEEPWLTSEALVNTLAAMDGRFSRVALEQEKTEKGLRKYTDAEISHMIAQSRSNMETKNGVKYTNEQFKALQNMSTMAFKSATEVKTLGQVFDILKETIGSGWAASFKNIFGGLNDAKALFTPMKDELSNIIEQNALARNKMLSIWASKKGGGRLAMIEGIKNAWAAFLRVATAIKNAFRDIFPKRTAADLISMSKSFQNFTEGLKIGKDTAIDLKRTFRGVFALFGIGWEILKGFFGVIGDLFGVMGKGSDGFLNFTGNIGDFLVVLHAAIRDGGLLNGFFDGLATVLSVPIQLIQTLAKAIASLFDGFDPTDANAAGDSIRGLGGSMERLTQYSQVLIDGLKRVGAFLKPFGSAISDALGQVTTALAEAFKTGDFGVVMDALKVGLLGGILLTIKKFFKNGLKLDLTGGVADAVKSSFDTLTGSLKDMQRGVQAKTILNIATAVALLTASVVALTLLDPKKMTTALVGMGALFTEMVSAFVVLTKFAGKGAFLQTPIIAAALVVLAGAIVILTGAVMVLSTLSWDELSRGLGALGLMLAGIVGFAATLGGSARLMAVAGAAMIPLALGISILSGVVVVLSKMNWDELARGGAGLAGMLAILAVALSSMSGGIVGATAILIVAPALLVLTHVLKEFSKMSWEEFGKSMAVLAGALTILGLGLFGLSYGIVGAAALLIITPALLALAATMKIMGKMSWSQIGKGMVALGGALLVLAIGLTAMIIALPGAIALTVAAKGLAVLTVVLAALGQLKWSEIAKGLVALAGLFAVIAAGGVLITAAIPALLGLGLAVVLLGAGFALVGVGMLAFGAGLLAISQIGKAGIQTFKDLIALLPSIATAFTNSLVASVVAVGKGAGQIAQAFGQLIVKLINIVIKLSPKFAQLLNRLLKDGLNVIRSRFGQFVDVGFDMLYQILVGLDKNMPRLVDKGADIVVKFLNGISRNADRIAIAGRKMIVTLAQAIATQLVILAAQMYQNARNLAGDLLQGLVDKIQEGIGWVVDTLKDLGSKAIDGLKGVFNINSPSRVFADIGDGVVEGLVLGIDRSAKHSTDAVNSMGKGAINAMHQAMTELNAATLLPDLNNPTITPVLDLSQMTKEANRMGSILAVHPIIPQVSYAQAVGIAEVTEEDRQNRSDSGETAPVVYEVSVEQNNTYPKAPATGEQYRDTKSLFSLFTSTIS